MNQPHRLERLERRALLASPLVITAGGTYSGEWESLDRNVPAVLVKTSQPVIIENAVIRGRGDLIKSGTSHTNITVRNAKGYGLNPNVAGKIHGEWIDLDQFDNLVVENSYFEHGAGINLLNYAGDRTAAETVKIINNVVRNVDGRKSNGAGGYLDYNTRRRKSDGLEEDGFDYAQFLQFDKVLNVPGIEVAWNEVINEPGNSRAEDVISVYKSSGTAASPLRIHDNYIDGAYTIKPWQGDTSDATYTYDWGFSGGGIMLGDGVGANAAGDPAFVRAYNNTVASTTNYGIAIAAGHDHEFYDNRVLSAGKLDDGRVITQQNVGLYIWDASDGGSAHFFNNKGYNNVSGWVKGAGRNDWWSPESGMLTNNTHWAGTVTLATEAAEHAAWKQRHDAEFPGGNQPPVPNDPDPYEPESPATMRASGIVFNDKDGDGVIDRVDVGVSGRTVYQDLDDDGVRDAGEPSAVTDAGGQYTITLSGPAGEQAVLRQVVPSAWYAASGSDRTKLKLTNGAVVSNVDFGSVQYAQVSGSVFADANRTASRDTAEAGLGGWVVYVDSNNNGWRDAGERQTTTDAKGNWTFTNLRAGMYNVRIVQKNLAMVRTTASFFRHLLGSGSRITSDHFGYAGG